MFDKEARLRDECLALEAALHGKKLELSLHLGKREEAVLSRKEMERVVLERRDQAMRLAEGRGEDYFVAAAEFDGRVMRESGAHQ